MAGFDAAAFAGWSAAAAVLMGVTALSYRAYCGNGRRGRSGAGPSGPGPGAAARRDGGLPAPAAAEGAARGPGAG